MSFANSALLPDAVKQEVAALDGLVNEDAELMINTQMTECTKATNISSKT